MAWALTARSRPSHPPRQDETRVAPVNVHSLVFDQGRGALITGCADGVVRLHFTDGQAPSANDAPLPTELTGAGWGPGRLCGRNQQYLPGLESPGALGRAP
jgi:hypothetical protein